MPQLHVREDEEGETGGVMGGETVLVFVGSGGTVVLLLSFAGSGGPVILVSFVGSGPVVLVSFDGFGRMVPVLVSVEGGGTSPPGVTTV